MGALTADTSRSVRCLCMFGAAVDGSIAPALYNVKVKGHVAKLRKDVASTR